jgi:hypothetical protein
MGEPRLVEPVLKELSIKGDHYSFEKKESCEQQLFIV